ncbi:MAG: NTP transferase domain-containing protein [Candidatus Omnitrophica bacterium]|nr:NTP transferase domain-containing protein [Candidatus Omnitrophota bacterium]
MTDSKIIAVIPIRGSDPEFAEDPNPMLAGVPLLEYTIRSARESLRLDRVIVSTDHRPVAEACRRLGAESPFLRPAELSRPSATVTDVLLHAVEQLKRQEGYGAEWVVKLEVTHPFRPKGMIDDLIETALEQGLDSAFVAYEEVQSHWTLEESGRLEQLGQGVDLPRGQRRPFYREASGLAALTRVENLKEGRLYGNNVGLVPLRDLFALVDTHEGPQTPSYRQRAGFRLAELLAPGFQKALSL